MRAMGAEVLGVLVGLVIVGLGVAAYVRRAERRLRCQACRMNANDQWKPASADEFEAMMEAALRIARQRACNVRQPAEREMPFITVLIPEDPPPDRPWQR